MSQSVREEPIEGNVFLASVTRIQVQWGEQVVKPFFVADQPSRS